MSCNEQIRKSTDFNLARLEADVTEVRPDGTLASIALPDYVEHQEGVPRVGTLSAEAVVRDHEAAAKEIEAMGAEVHDAIAFMRDTAAAYREEAKKIFKRIEACALFTQDVRKTCEDVRRRMMEGNATY